MKELKQKAKYNNFNNQYIKNKMNFQISKINLILNLLLGKVK